MPQGRIEELLRRFRVEATDELGGIFDIGEQHRHLLAFTGQVDTGGEDFLTEIRWRVGVRSAFRCRSWCRGWWGSGRRAGPHEHGAILIHGHLLYLDELCLQVFEIRLVQLKLPLQGTIRHAPMTLQQGHHLFQHFVERHVGNPSALPGAGAPSQGMGRAARMMMNLALRLIPRFPMPGKNPGASSSCRQEIGANQCARVYESPERLASVYV
jgi:hypothetical protein